MGTNSCLVTSIQQKKEAHSGLEQAREQVFLITYSKHTFPSHPQNKLLRSCSSMNRLLTMLLAAEDYRMTLSRWENEFPHDDWSGGGGGGGGLRNGFSSCEQDQLKKNNLQRKCWEVVVIVISGASSLSLSLHPKMMILRWVLSASHGLIELTR